MLDDLVKFSSKLINIKLTFLLLYSSLSSVFYELMVKSIPCN